MRPQAPAGRVFPARTRAGLSCAVYVRAMFETGHDAANRAAFMAESPDAPDLVGVALRGSRKDVDKATKPASLHG